MADCGRDETALYRHFNAYGDLLYVGISLCATTRLSQHQKDKSWFREIARIEVEWFCTRQEAMDAEITAIRAEHPRYNIAGAISGTTAGLPDDRVERWPIPAAHALIAWDDDSDRIAVGYLWRNFGRNGFDRHYECTTGACNRDRERLNPTEQTMRVLLDYYSLTYICGVLPEAVHRAFLNIAEFQEVIKRFGMGPGRDEPGYEPDAFSGRTSKHPPSVRIIGRWSGGAEHIRIERAAL